MSYFVFGARVRSKKKQNKKKRKKRERERERERKRRREREREKREEEKEEEEEEEEEEEDHSTMCSPNSLLINHVHALALTVPQPVRHRLVHHLKSTFSHRKQHGELSL